MMSDQQILGYPIFETHVVKPTNHPLFYQKWYIHTASQVGGPLLVFYHTNGFRSIA